MMLPNGFLIGAPKCGTSSVARWLAAHPEACSSTPKEPFFFMDQENPRAAGGYHERGLDGYTKFFCHCPSDVNFIFEGTTHYLYQQTATTMISKLQPSAQFIILLREPAARILSSFRYSQNNLATVSKKLTFAQYVDCLLNNQSEMLRGHFSSPMSEYVLLNELKYSHYLPYINKWLTHFDRQQLHIFLFEEMRQNPKRFMQTLAQRLDLNPDFYETYSFEQHNATYRIRNQALHRAVWAIGKKLPKRSNLRQAVKNIYFAFQKQKQTKQTSQSTFITEALHRLRAYYRPLNEQLASHFALDLTLWNTFS